MRNKNLIIFCFITLISIFPLLDLAHPGLPITHDGQDHVARIANFYANLEEGNIVPRWASNLNWGYGHPILMFLYPLPSYVASIFHFFGFSLVDSVKIVFAAGFFLSGIVMYVWTSNFLDKRSAFFASLLYLFAPYRFVDLYVRGAIGEHIAFIFPPLVFWAILKLNRTAEKKYLTYGTLALSGLILSHNAITIMFLPLFFLYFVFIFYFGKRRKLFLFQFISLIILGFGLASFFVLPAFFEGKYTLRDIVTAKTSLSFSSVGQFLFGEWNYGGTGAFTVQIGLIQLFFIVLSLFFLVFAFRKNKQTKILLACLELLFLLTLFLMTSQSNVIWEKVTLLQKFQFPWRFLSLAVFISAAIGGITFSAIKEKYKNIFLLLIVSVLLFVNKDYWRAKGYLIKPEIFYTGIYNSTTDTGESAPIWSVRFMEKRPKSRLETIEGEGNVLEVNRFSTKHVYQITSKEGLRIRENTLYFPGWEVFVDGKKVPIEFQDPANRGLITFFLEEGIHTVKIKFTETKLRILADSISIVGLVFVTILGILKKRLLWPHFR